MKTLIIPDIHTNHEKAEALLQGSAWDKAVLLGDYFDDWDDTPEQNKATAEWLKDVLARPNVTCLMGNHDYAYYKSLWCSGKTPEKQRAIRSVLADEDFAKLKISHWVGTWLLTHAGMDCRWENDRDMWSLYGPLWVRPDYFEPIFAKQIFGHTIHREPWRKVIRGFEQVDLDTQLRHYATLDDDKLEIFEW